MDEKRKALLKMKSHFSIMSNSLDEIRSTMNAHNLFDLSKEQMTELAETIAQWRSTIECALSAMRPITRFEENMEDARQQGNAAADEEMGQ